VLAIILGEIVDAVQHPLQLSKNLPRLLNA
jgi:hypothetical protein